MTEDDNNNNNNNNNNSKYEIKIPKNSFTAFRLKYCDALELYNTSTVIFIGNVPNAWILDKKSILLARLNRLDDMNTIRNRHPEHNTLKDYENAANFIDTTISNIDIEKSHHSLKNKLLTKLTHRPDFHLKSNEINNENHNITTTTTNNNNNENKNIHDNLKSFLHPSSTLNSFLINISNHHLYNTLSHTASDIQHSIHFNIPRQSFQDKNMEFHLLMNNKLLNSDSESDLDTDNENSENNIENSSFTSSYVPYIENNNTNNNTSNNNTNNNSNNNYTSLSNSTNNIVTKTQNTNNINKIPDSLRLFFEKSNEEKQEILKNEIDDAMVSLQNSYNNNNNNDEYESDSDNESFTTASETPLDSPKNISNDVSNITENKTVDFDTTKDRKSVTFDTLPTLNHSNEPKSVKMNNSASMYTLQSKKLLLDKQTPFPYENDYDKYNDEVSLLSKEGKINYDINETYTSIDDDVAETYKLLKTKTLGAKLGLSDEINKFERKRKMKKLLKNFQAGEIIKMEKMLVMVSTIEKFQLNSDSKKSSRILQRWREYITVVRATNDIDYPAIIQFFKSNQIFRRDDSGKLKREIYEEELDRQRKEDEEEEAEEEEEATSGEYDTEKDIDTNTGNSQEPSIITFQNHGESTIDEELDNFDNQNNTLMERDKNSTLKSTLKKFKNVKTESLNKKKDKKKIDDLKKKITIDDNSIGKSCNQKKDKNCHFSLVLSRHDITVNFANLLDKSIRITKEKKSCTIVYTLLAHSTSSAIVWLSFLRQLLDTKSSHDRKQALLISLPSLNVSFTITGLKTFYRTYVEEHAINSQYIIIKYNPNGYQYPPIKSFDKMLDLIERKIVELEKYGKLPNDPMAREFLNRIKTDRSFLALTFRKYDRLEWILGESECLIQILWNIYASSYELELREFQHESHILSDRSLVEPLPIEGFVTKLSNRRGKLTSKIGRQYYKLLYAFTVENLLFFQDFYDAVPILPNSEISQRNLISPAGDILNLKELENAASFDPVVYQSTPYPRTAHHIKWLKPGITPEEYADNDANALYEAERRACMISNANSIIDLCKVTDIKLVPKEDISLILRAASHQTWKHPKSAEPENKDNSLFRTFSKSTSIIDNDDEYIENCFELVMDNGSVLRIQVSTKSIRNEWAKNLGKLSEYWTLKKREDLARHVMLKEKNLKLMNTKNDDCYESLIANESETSCSKWELSKAYTDTQLYSISSYVLDKPVLMEGYLYCKKFKGKQFKLLYAVLSPGFFVVYDIFQRKRGTGVARNSTYYSRYATISLASCYIFASTGKSSTDGKGQVFFSLSSGEDGLPRVYGDGWRSSESVYERSFTIWFGSKKIMMKNIKKKAGTKLNNGKKRDSFSSLKSNQSDSNNEKNLTDKNMPKKRNRHRICHLKLNNFNKKSNDVRNLSSDENSSEEFHDNPLEYSSDSEPNSEAIYDSEYDSDESDESDSTFDSEIAKDIFKANKPDATEKLSTTELLKSVSKLGVGGRAINFLARSRVDRDLWVTRLMTEVERFSGSRNNDIELV